MQLTNITGRKLGIFTYRYMETRDNNKYSIESPEKSQTCKYQRFPEMAFWQKLAFDILGA